jgi:serine/threonine-protein kinase
MAQILLARLSGPRKFERPVVIKRMLPHLAGRPEFRSMFLDEARLAARIRHANVAQVHELGVEGDELYLVMEYLEGESASSLQRAVAGAGERLDLRLGAYIVAECCAGLHAAHELRDDDDRLLGLVHRDCSPQNVFLGYDGSVRVLDFGIAKSAGRETRTQAGEIKGKFEYMSPEQCLGEELDRRSDIFSLGIVLFELTVFRRLFKRPSELMVLKAITEEPIALPSSIVPGYPPGVEAVCLRALARAPEQRYATAAAMRSDLLAAMREIEVSGDPRDQLAALMAELFGARRDDKREMLRRFRSGPMLSVVPSAEPAVPAELLSVAEPAEQTGVGATRVGARRRSTLPVLGAAAFGVGLLGLGVIALRAPSGSGASGPPATPSSAASAMGTGTSPAVPGPAASSAAGVSSTPAIGSVAPGKDEGVVRPPKPARSAWSRSASATTAALGKAAPAATSAPAIKPWL